MKTRAIAVILALVSTTTPAFAGPDGTIELYNVAINNDGSPGATDFNACQAPVTVLFNGAIGRISIGVYMRLSGASLAGISGFECFVDGLEVGTDIPAGWSVIATLAPGILSIGDLTLPHMSGGNIVRRMTATWTVESETDPNCQKNPLVFLARLDLSSPLFNPAMPNDVVVTAKAGDPPANPTFMCPLTFLCNKPAYTPNCATGTRYVINPVAESCLDAVQQKSWGAVKELFR